ncbi:hypothetical protein F5X96DRAFT_659872 [Biscogniauxia mediterranea]|nr:hypothetical protein F5X96DRAFT_659872 [Biscogniauxia mediterranea]
MLGLLSCSIIISQVPTTLFSVSSIRVSHFSILTMRCRGIAACCLTMPPWHPRLHYNTAYNPTTSTKDCLGMHVYTYLPIILYTLLY